MARRLRDLTITEVSGVDRGAGQGVQILLMKRDEGEPYWKRDFTQEQRDHAASSGAALPDGSYPIQNKGDLKNAIAAIGRAKDPGKAKAHIKSRAEALGATDMLPDDWQKRQESEMALSAEMQKALDDAVKTATASMQETINKQAAELQVLKLTDAENAHCSDEKMTEDQRKAFAAKTPEERAAAMKKRADQNVDPVAVAVAKALAPMQEQLTDLQKRNQALQAEADKVTFEKRAHEMGLRKDDGEMVRKAFSGDVDAQTALAKRIKEISTALSETQRAAGIFKELGSTGGDGNTGPDDELKAKAAELRKADPKLSDAQAYSKASELHPDIFARVRQEELRKIAPAGAA